MSAFLSKSKNKDQRVSILGKIIFMEVKFAESDDNPYNIPQGSEYHLCYAEPFLKSYSKKNVQKDENKEV